MTDHRANDLSYGHLGEASYDVDEKCWNFSSDTGPKSSIQPLQPLQECISPSLQAPPSTSDETAKARRSQEIWLRKALPEAGPAKATITAMIKAHRYASSASPPSSLLAFGKAADIDQTSKTRSTQIMAMAYGEAGNLLRLIKPQVEALKWDTQHDTKLRSLNPAAGEDCYWLGSGGAIQQITFGADSDGSTSWLAVLKEESITILRPIYCRDQTPSSISIDADRRFPPSRMKPNPILSLSNERTGARPYADVAFNPWYIRQFAVVDRSGYWSVWDIEGQKRRRKTFEARPGKCGNILDDSKSDQDLKFHDSADGWGRLLWAGGVSTLVVCNRRNLAVFDMKAAPKRLHSPEVVRPKSTDWIIDMKRSPANLSFVFVLTTRQVFWLQIIEAGEDQEDPFGHGRSKILLSCEHFRNHEDESAKLELLEGNEGCTVLLYSNQSMLVNTYRFNMTLGESTRPICSQGSFVIESSNRDKVENPHGMIQTLCMFSTTFMLHNLRTISGPAKLYADHNVHFYQLFGLSSALGLYHAICATKWAIPSKSNLEPIKYHNVIAPTIRDGRVGKIKSAIRVVGDQFIVPDGFEEEDEIFRPFNMRHALSKTTSFNVQHNMGQDARFSIDARRLFTISFLEKQSETPEYSTSPGEGRNMAEYSRTVQSAIEARKNSGLQGLVTFLDLIGYEATAEDIDEAASALRDLMKALSSTAEAPGTMRVTPLAFRPFPFMLSDVATSSAKSIPDLSDVYDKMVELWVSCLPGGTPGSTRLAKEKLVRGIAVELCLSSLGVFIRDKSVIIPKPVESQEGTDFVLTVRSKPDSSENTDRKSRQNTPAIPSSGLHAPAGAPSLTSNQSATPNKIPAEDGAISRLRGYTSAIKPQPPLGASRSAILMHWPSVPGADPLNYSWEASRKSIIEGEDVESDEEEALNRQRGRDRRRRRTEKFLQRNRVNTSSTASQPLPVSTFGSQPDPAEHPISSQTKNLPMTQPDRGAFGSRVGPKSFKKRRTMGF